MRNWVVILFCASLVAAGTGCSFINKERMLYPQPGSGELIHGEPDSGFYETAGKPTELRVHEGDVMVTVDMWNRGESIFLFGPLIPIIPGFLVNWFIAEELNTNRLTFHVSVHTGVHEVSVSYDSLTVILADREPLDVASVEVWTVKHGVYGDSGEYVLFKHGQIRYPTERYLTDDGRCVSLVHFHTGMPNLETVRIRVSGILVDGRPMKPFTATFRRDLTWKYLFTVMNS